MSRPRTTTTAHLPALAALLVLAALFLIPVYVMVTAALKPASQADAVHMWELPRSLDLSGLSEAWSKLSPNVRNSLIMVLPATTVSSVVGALNGFVLAKLPFRGSNAPFAAMLLGMFIPYQVILVPLVRFLQYAGLYGTLSGLILSTSSTASRSRP
jgi:glucose/mannose transport system permease protein